MVQLWGKESLRPLYTVDVRRRVYSASPCSHSRRNEKPDEEVGALCVPVCSVQVCVFVANVVAGPAFRVPGSVRKHVFVACAFTSGMCMCARASVCKCACDHTHRCMYLCACCVCALARMLWGEGTFQPRRVWGSAFRLLGCPFSGLK